MIEPPFPALAPYDAGLLDVGDGQRIYWQVTGNPVGKPAVALHGGPGAGLGKGLHRRFDPTKWRLVQFDQRGCGRSTPHAGDWSTELTHNTTHHLVRDIEALRRHLGIDRWLVWGASWGVTLALAYAERFPERVTEMILLSVALTRPADVRWFTQGVRRFFPEEWERFRAGADGDLAAIYDRRINHDADARAVDRWMAWEDTLVSLDGRPPSPALPPQTGGGGEGRIAFARLVTHYFSHAAWLEEDEILTNAVRLSAIPGVILHGRLDLQGPPGVAWDLARAWPGAELHLFSSGHSGNAEMEREMVRALDRFAR